MPSLEWLLPIRGALTIDLLCPNRSPEDFSSNGPFLCLEKKQRPRGILEFRFGNECVSIAILLLRAVFVHQPFARRLVAWFKSQMHDTSLSIDLYY